MNKTIGTAAIAASVLLQAAGPATANSPEALVRAFYDRVDAATQSEGDLEAFFAEGFKDHNRPGKAPPEFADKAVALNLFKELKTGFPDSKHTLDIVRSLSDDTAMVYWTFSGTQTGVFFGMTPSNKSVKINGVDIFRIENEQFVEQWHVEELMQLFAQLGVR